MDKRCPGGLFAVQHLETLCQGSGNAGDEPAAPRLLSALLNPQSHLLAGAGVSTGRSTSTRSSGVTSTVVGFGPSISASSILLGGSSPPPSLLPPPYFSPPVLEVP